MALKRLFTIEDREFVAVLRSLGEAIDWEPDDPRLPGLADRLARFLDSHTDWAPDVEREMGAGLIDLMDSIALDSFPAGRRLEALLEDRGWSGWTLQQRSAGR